MGHTLKRNVSVPFRCARHFTFLQRHHLCDGPYFSLSMASRFLLKEMHANSGVDGLAEAYTSTDSSLLQRLLRETM